MNNIEWTRVAEAASFEDKPEQLVKVKRDDIFVVKDDDGFHAINNRCPHLGLALNLGGCNMQNKTVHCKFHSSDFSYQTGEVKEWLNVKGFEKFMMWLFSKFDADAKKMMEMPPTPVETFMTKVEDGHVYVGIDMGA
jgi:nitrite reductase/ring-hydroxylating ferredoxin subunit